MTEAVSGVSGTSSITTSNGPNLTLTSAKDNSDYKDATVINPDGTLNQSAYNKLLAMTNPPSIFGVYQGRSEIS